MKKLMMLLALLSLTACNKGIKKPQSLNGLLPNVQNSTFENKNKELIIESEFRTAKGFGCNLELKGDILPIFVEAVDVNGQTKYSLHLAVESEANKTMVRDLNLKGSLDVAGDKEILKTLGFSKHQIKKIDQKKGDTVDTSSELFFDEEAHTGELVRTSVAKDADGKKIKSTSDTIGQVTNCEESELEIEI